MQKESKKTFQAWLRKRLGRKKTPKFYRGQEKFRNRYPDYEVGVGTYGLPKVHDWQEGTTLRVGAYTSIADDVHIFLGGHHRVDWISSYPFSRLFLRKPVISATLAAVAAMSESATMCGWRRASR